ncbi:hypothetical protein DKX38_024060 [Salix brachista]|uniref:Uncharacterized protein n=1 Tax=Salix brachista TaxID=2182728 RepID=A0A5N5JKD5_9ROSI|nr:hypothetical protein DKX38_024060 [Salix brachista]
MLLYKYPIYIGVSHISIAQVADTSIFIHCKRGKKIRDMASECQGKSSWPELLGAQARVAVVTIETQNPYVDTQVVLEGTPVTTDFLCTRVRVWIDQTRIVTRVPVIG